MSIQEIQQGPPGPRVLSVNGKKVGDTVYAEYPQQDFRLSLPKAVTEHLKPQLPGFTVRLWRSIRRLVRKRQESQLVWDARKKSATARAEHLNRERDLQQELIKRDLRIKHLEEQLKNRERDLATLNDSELPRLNNKIGVLEDEISLLGAKHQRDLAREKAEIAVHNQRIVGSDADNWQRRMMGE